MLGFVVWFRVVGHRTSESSHPPPYGKQFRARQGEPPHDTCTHPHSVLLTVRLATSPLGWHFVSGMLL